MKFSAPVFPLTLILALSSTPSRAWMGIKTKAGPERPSAAAAATPAASAAPIPDSVFPAQVRTIPVGSRGAYLGTLEGVRCFNCTPGRVVLNLGDSLSHEAATLALRSEVWNAIERPVKDRRLFDYGNRCFFFGYQDKDTVLAGGAWVETSPQSVACYPYLQRSNRPGVVADSTAQAFRSASQAGDN